MISLDSNQIMRLRELGVEAVYLFGSHAQGTATNNSDLDLGVLMRDASRVKPEVDTLPLYQELYNIFADLLPTDRDTILDIVFLQSGVSLELQANVVRNGKLLLDENPRVRADYEAQVMIRAADFVPVLRIMDEAILERI